MLDTEKKTSSETITLTASELRFIVVKIVIILIYYTDIIYSVHLLLFDMQMKDSLLSSDPNPIEIK